jgi:hypothetical protein
MGWRGGFAAQVPYRKLLIENLQPWKEHKKVSPLALNVSMGLIHRITSTLLQREHYGWTLRQWVRRLEQHADEARRLTDETS